MRAARLLSQREYETDQKRDRQGRAGKPRTRIEQYEIECHQRESAAGVGPGIALAAGQVVRPVGEQGDARAVAAVTPEFPRAVDIGRLLQQADGRRAKDQGADQEGCGATQVA